MIFTLRTAKSYQPRAGMRRFARVSFLIAHFDVGPRRVLDRLKYASARHSRGHFGRALLGDPDKPIRPPRTGVLLGFGEPAVDIRIARFRSGPILVFVLFRRIDHAGNVT